MQEYGSLYPTSRKKVTPCAEFKMLDSKRRSILSKCEQYALWTIPSVFTKQDSFTPNQELVGPIDSTGAQAVNNLSNKVVMTLFPPANPFFRLMVSDDDVAALTEQAKAGDEQAQAILDNLDKSLALAERRAMRELDYSNYRTEATNVAKALIVTGNSLMYHPEGKGKAQAYSLKDYVVCRDLSGTIIKIITRDTKALFTFSPDIQKQIIEYDRQRYNNHDKPVTLYTRIELKEDGKYHLEQSADETPLDSSGFWTADDLPYVVLTWNLLRGEDYGRGLVEDYAGAFHGLYVLTNAFVDAVGVAADIKWLVRPTSLLDVARLNNSKSGSYHSGEEGDIVAVQVNKQNDLQLVQAMVTMWQTQIGKAFMLMQSVQRNAERVTAEEIRYMVNDLEVSNGGIYSRLSTEWQLRTAKISLKRIDINIGEGQKIFPQIITGLDSLSRAGDLDNLRLFIQDLAMLNGVPESLLKGINPARFMAFIGVRRGVDYDKFLMTPAELQQVQQQEMQLQQQQQQQAVEAESNGKMAVEAGKAALQ